jgi:flagellar motor component MotA
MLVTCPHCKTELAATPELFGQTVQCPACKGRLEVPATETAVETSPSSRVKPQRTGWDERDHANVHFLKCLSIGVVLTACFFALLIPFSDTVIGGLFLKRGWVNYAETFLFIWGMTILFAKWKQNQRQARATMLELFPERLGREIHCDNVGGFIDNIYKIPLTMRDSLIVNRIRKALELFENRPDNGEVAAFLSTQSDIDANRSSGSYSLLKVFLWAIPILGFIGTVQGLSTAVSALSMGDTSDPAALKSSIDSLTGGLGVAFDTTLLGLILSMFMSFPMAAVQKAEDETLTIIDAFCTEKLLPKLNDSRNASTGELLEQAESIPQLVASLARAHETFLVNLNGATQMLSQAGDSMNKRLATHQETVEKSFTEAVSKLSDTGIEVFIRSQVEMTKTLEKMATGIELLNKALRDIGANQIPDTAKKKRGFFGR